MENEFLDQSSVINYSSNNYEKSNFSTIAEIVFTKNDKTTRWLNTYGNKYRESFKRI